MAYIRHIKTGSTQLRIPDLVQIDDDVTESRDFSEMNSAMECVPPVNTHVPAAAGLHIKHNHLALISTYNVKSTQQGSESERVSLLKRSNQSNVPYSPSRNKILKLSEHSSKQCTLMTINNAALNKSSSVSEMTTLLKCHGLATPNKHVRDIPGYKWPASHCVSVENKPCVNISWLPQTTQQNYLEPNHVKQTNLHPEPSATVSTLRTNSSVHWKHYGIGQLSLSRGTYNYKSTTTASSERFGKNAFNPYNRQNFLASTPRAPQQYKLMQRKPPTPIVRNKHAPVLTAVPQKSNLTLQGHMTEENITSHGVNRYKSPEEMSNKQPGSVVRRISFSPENETQRWPIEGINLDPISHTGDSLVPIESGVNISDINVQEFNRYLDNRIMKQKNDVHVFDLCDQLKNIKPYVISGWISSTYLLALMQKSNLVNEMFDNALDSVGDIRPEVVKNCRKTTPAILARDLVFRLFTLEQLNGLNLQKLSKKRMWAIHRCIKKHFPDFNLRCWRKKCIPQIKASVLTLFRHRVKHVQEFWVSHSNSQPLDLTKAV